MPKKSYRWEQLLVSVFVTGTVQNWHGLTISSQQMSQIVSKGLIAIAILSLWLWNGKLLLATGIGISLMWLVYQMSARKFRRLWHNLIQLLTGYNRKLLVAVASGSFGGLVTYMIAAIWADTENHWLAIGSILQGLVTLITLVVLGWHVNQQQSEGKNLKFEHLLESLTATDPLKRLIAIRQLTNLARQSIGDREQIKQLIEYFQFMLTQPQEQVVQEALFDSLELLGIRHLSLNQSSTLQKPIQLKHSLREII